ncbi:hypothetical protein B5F40_13585 [Gordonibacter sp. An230]|nr:hypothetical protein B5F40_13585 [Gordonibacter sp. An230]
MFSNPFEKRTRSKGGELLEEVEHLALLGAKAEARNDALAQDIAANERKQLVQRFSKQISARYISATMSNCIMLVSFLFCFIGSILFAQMNNITRIFWIATSVICLTLALAHALLILFDLPFWAPVKYLRGRRFSKASGKAGYFIFLERTLNAIETKARCHLVDARPYAKAFKLPLADSIYAFDDPHRPLDDLVTDHVIENLEQRLPDKTHTVLVCSEFGRESHEIVVKLRERGYADAYDLGETATRYALFQRFAHQLHYLAIEKGR